LCVCAHYIKWKKAVPAVINATIFYSFLSLHRSGHRIAVTWPTNPIEMWTFRIDFKMVKLCTNEKEVC